MLDAHKVQTASCYDSLDPLQALLINYNSTAMQPAEHDIRDWTSTESWLNLPTGLSVQYEVYKAAKRPTTSILLVYVIPMGVTSNRETSLQLLEWRSPDRASGDVFPLYFISVLLIRLRTITLVYGIFLQDHYSL